MDNITPAETGPAVTAAGVRRRTAVLLSVLFMCGVVALALINWAILPDSVKHRPATAAGAPSNSGPVPRPTHSFVQAWKIVLPASTDNYTRQPDDRAATSAAEQLRAAGAKDPVAAVYASDLDPRDVVVISGATGTAFGRDPEAEINVAMTGFMPGDVVRLRVPALGGKGACAGSVTCVFVTDGVTLNFTFSGPDTARSADAAAQVPRLSIDIVKRL
jgi:hypothetical protein